MGNYGNIGEGNPTPNPIVQTGLLALESDNFFFVENPEEQYVGPYHEHEDGTLMIGEGVMGINHELNPSEIIFQRANYSSIQETREVVSDIFYKIWFESNTLTDDEILSMQTTIRDGIKQTGRTEDEPLVFYKKDRNTLESRKDLQGETFEQMCLYIFDNNITELEYLFSIRDDELDGNITRYKIVFDNGRYEIVIAEKQEDKFLNILNLSQLTKPKTGSKIDPEKAREVLDTNIFELLPTQTTRQDEIDDFFSDFNSLIGNPPDFFDDNDDGFQEAIRDYDEDENERISSQEAPANASITRLDNQANLNNVNQTLQSMRNRLNEYLKDADARLILGDAADSLGGVSQTIDEFGNIIYRYTLADLQPEYENKSNGFLKIRKPNQAIIIRGQNNNLLEFQKQDGNGVPSYLSDGFTITMWVRFVDKQSSGTLFNFGNPLEENGSGFRLETRTSIDSNEDYRRWIRLVVKDDLVRDNHFGDDNVKRRPASLSSPLDFYAERNFHKLYPEISIDNLDEWYFICATYNPNVIEPDNFDDNYEYIQNKQFWLNHVDENGDIISFSGLGAKCKVEIISKSDLLKARGYKVGDIEQTTTDDSEETQEEVQEEETQEETSNVEPMPSNPPAGFNPMTNPMTGTLSPQGQWSWNGVSITWVAVETEEESSEPVATNTPDNILNFGAGGGDY
tara:strand:+ start:468 stop:2513 length:2046 start_codon:yes stop_codon:yes gene_type:complete